MRFREFLAEWAVMLILVVIAYLLAKNAVSEAQLWG